MIQQSTIEPGTGQPYLQLAFTGLQRKEELTPLYRESVLQRQNRPSLEVEHWGRVRGHVVLSADRPQIWCDMHPILTTRNHVGNIICRWLNHALECPGR